MKRRGFFRCALALLGLKAVGVKATAPEAKRDLVMHKVQFSKWGNADFASLEVGTIYYARDTARFWYKRAMPNYWECFYDTKREGSHLHVS